MIEFLAYVLAYGCIAVIAAWPLAYALDYALSWAFDIERLF